MRCCLVCLADHGSSAAAEDMWHVYNLVRAGDKVTAVTFRKIAVHGAGGSESERVKIKLAISVEAVDFDPEGRPFSFTLDKHFPFSGLLAYNLRRRQHRPQGTLARAYSPTPKTM